MTTVNLKQYSERDTFREISARTFVAVMNPHREILLGRGIVLPPIGREGELDIKTMEAVCASPDGLPAELVETLHKISQMSGPETMDRIIDTVRERQLELTFPANSSPKDVAAHLLLNDRVVFEELCAEKSATRFRAFTYFVAREARAGFRPPASMAALEKTLDGWYESHQRARTARVTWRQHGHEFWFHIRHAEPIKHDGCVNLVDLQSGSMIYRPERHGLVIYDSAAAEMRLHAGSEGEAELFRQGFGLRLFGDADHFPLGRAKYTLDPLRKWGRAALACAGIDGLAGVKLTGLELCRRGEPGVRDSISAPDVFTAYESRQFRIPAEAEIRLAKFSVQFRDARKPRALTIRPSNFASFTRDEDAARLHEWLSRQGFVLTNGTVTPNHNTNHERFTLEHA